MATHRDFPEIAFVRVLTAGGPYNVGTILSIAFGTPGIGRLAAHDGSTDVARNGETSLVPETISARVVRGAGPYSLGSSLTLSFVDPSIARIHATDTPDDRRTERNAAPAPTNSPGPPSTSERASLQPAVTLDARYEPTVRIAAPARTDTSPIAKTVDLGEHAIEPGEAMVMHAPPLRAAAPLSPAPSEIVAPVGPAPDPTGAAGTAAPVHATPANATPSNAAAEKAAPAASPEQNAPKAARTIAHSDAIRSTTISFSPPGPLDAGATIAAETIASLIPSVSLPRVAAQRRNERDGVRVRLDWNRDRVRRFVQVVDKLFTVDRLGWYRHVFAMRLLVPDIVVCGEAQTDVEALRHLHALRAASIETLGRPLLAAFMPNFAVNEEWLDSLDRPGAARALAGLRDALLPLANENPIAAAELEPSWTVAAIGKRELGAASAANVEALLPLFIPYASPVDVLTEKLAGYRTSLIDIFGQTALSASAVRLNLMAEPNHTLDDRLSQLARAVNETFGGLAVA
jgi:hypothetical protein